MVNFKGRTDSKATHDADSLRQIVVTVRNLLAPAIRLAGDPDDAKSQGAMQSGGVKNLEIYYFQSLERAMTELSRWGGACESAWQKTLMDRGFSGGKANSAKPVAKLRSPPRRWSRRKRSKVLNRKDLRRRNGASTSALAIFRKEIEILKSQNVISKSIDRDGYVLLRGVLEAAAVARARGRLCGSTGMRRGGRFRARRPARPGLRRGTCCGCGRARSI